MGRLLAIVLSPAPTCLFALTISFAAYALAARFTTQPLWAALLVASSPLVQVNNNTLAIPEGPTLAFSALGRGLVLARALLGRGNLPGVSRLRRLAGAGAPADPAAELCLSADVPTPRRVGGRGRALPAAGSLAGAAIRAHPSPSRLRCCLAT